MVAIDPEGADATDQLKFSLLPVLPLPSRVIGVPTWALVTSAPALALMVGELLVEVVGQAARRKARQTPRRQSAKPFINLFIHCPFRPSYVDVPPSGVNRNDFLFPSSYRTSSALCQ
jgi:hypothetical protein